MGTQLSSVFKGPRILGLFPFDDRFQWSRKWLIYSIFIQLLTLPSMVLAFLHYYHTAVISGNRAFNVFITLSCLNNLLAFFCNVFTVIQLTRKRNLVFHLLDNMKKEIVECQEFPKRSFHTTYLNLFWCALFTIVWTIFDDGGFQLENLNETLMSLLSFTSTSCIIGQLQDLMKALTVLMRESTKEFDKGSILALERISGYEECINEIYGPLIFTSVISAFLELVWELYILLGPIFPNQLKLNILLIIFVLFCFIRLGGIIYPCNNFLHEIQWFNDKLHWKILNDKTGRYSNNEMFFFHFIAYKKTKFSACGFFDIDYTLIGTMISVCTTYLVIVLQYGQGSQS
ncbi:Gustatory receptor 104g [Halyomorpha halys]|nr:Gustatory receptor 104g [Halyomorpha halys]